MVSNSTHIRSVYLLKIEFAYKWIGFETNIKAKHKYTTHKTKHKIDKSKEWYGGSLWANGWKRERESETQTQKKNVNDIQTSSQ